MICNSNNQNRKIYDPDIVTVVTIVLAALGGIGGIVTTIDFVGRRISSKNEMRNKECRRKDVEKHIVNSFRDLSFSVTTIRRRLESLDRLCRGSLDIEDRFEKRKFRFGECPILLSEHDFRFFNYEQDRIFRDAREIQTNVAVIEELIADNQHLFENEDYIYNMKIKHKLRDLVESINDLMSGFGDRTIDEFLQRTIGLCHKIEDVCGFNKNWM